MSSFTKDVINNVLNNRHACKYMYDFTVTELGQISNKTFQIHLKGANCTLTGHKQYNFVLNIRSFKTKLHFRVLPLLIHNINSYLSQKAIGAIFY